MRRLRPVGFLFSPPGERFTNAGGLNGGGGSAGLGERFKMSAVSGVTTAAARRALGSGLERRRLRGSLEIRSIIFCAALFIPRVCYTFIRYKEFYADETNDCDVPDGCRRGGSLRERGF